MKVDVNSVKKQDIQTAKSAIKYGQEQRKIDEKSQNTQTLKALDANEVKNRQEAQNIKVINANIGRLQIAQKALDSIESSAKKLINLHEDAQETLDKNELEEIKTEIKTIKKDIQNTLKSAIFENSNVFSKVIKNSRGEVVFDATKVNYGLLENNIEQFYETIKSSKNEIKEALSALKNDANNNTKMLARTDSNSNDKDIQSTDSSFLKKFGSLFSSAHDTSKISTQRAKELLA